MIKPLVIIWIAWIAGFLFRLSYDLSNTWSLRTCLAALIATPIAAAYVAFFWEPALSIDWPLNVFEGLGIVACLTLRVGAILWYDRRFSKIRPELEEQRKTGQRPNTITSGEDYAERPKVITRVVWGSSDSYFVPHKAVWIVPKLSLVVLLAAGLAPRWCDLALFLVAWFVLDLLWRIAEEPRHIRWALLWHTSGYAKVMYKLAWWIALFLTGEAAVPILLRLSLSVGRSGWVQSNLEAVL